MSTLLGVDVGGTFTDFLLWDDGAIRVHKRPSTPDDPGRAVLDGLDHLGVTPELIVHGTTVATNAVLQRRGARTALVTTEGFRDLLTIGRQTRPYIYDLEPETPEPLVDPALLFECAGRPGMVNQAMDLAAVDGRVVVDPTATIERSTVRGPAIIGPGARIVDAYIGPFTSVGADVAVTASEIENSVLLDRAQLDGVPRLVDSLIGRDTEVTRSGRPPRATRLLLGDHCSVDLS